jgi:hypothetical protein
MFVRNQEMIYHTGINGHFGGTNASVFWILETKRIIDFSFYQRNVGLNLFIHLLEYDLLRRALRIFARTYMLTTGRNGLK